MIKKHTVLQQLRKRKVVAVIRGKDEFEAIAIAKASIKGGITVIELTYTTPGIERVFESLASEDCIIGAGTVLDAETARHAILNGAKFVVSPHFNEDISKISNRYGIPYLPGCMTITEIVHALEHGHDVIKLFPANNLEPSFIRSVIGPLPHVHLMPTGGINQDNIKQWMQNGAFAAGIGSDLTNAYRNGGSEAVKHLATKYIRILSEE